MHQGRRRILEHLLVLVKILRSQLNKTGGHAEVVRSNFFQGSMESG